MTNPASRVIIYLAFAGVAHLVERHLAKVEVASSSLVARSRKAPSEKMVLSFLQTAPRTRCLDLRAAREIIRGEAGLPRMAMAIRGMPGSEFEPRQNEAPAASTHARSAFRSGVSAGFLRSAARRVVGGREARNEPRFSRAPRHSPLQRIRKLSFGLGTYRL